MKHLISSLILVASVLLSSSGKAQTPKKLTSLAPNVMLSLTQGISVELYDGVSNGCMKWPTGVLQTAQERLAQASLFDGEAPRVLQIVANGYAEEGTRLCFVNVDLIIDELGDIYFNNGVETYSAVTRFDIWRTSFMISGPRSNMQAEIQSRVGRAVEELLADIERSKSIVHEEDKDFYDDFILLNVD